MRPPLSPSVSQTRLQEQDPQLLAALSRITKGLPAARVLLVGGFVRDLALGLRPKDLDVEVYGIEAKTLEEKLRALFPDATVNSVGKSFGILKIHLERDLELDVSLPRRESKTGKGHRDFTIESDPNMPFEDAARRRDFTWNALAIDARTLELMDPFDGLKDLENGQLRHIDAQTFVEDPLRVFRALQFCARFNLVPHEETLALMKDMVARGELDALSTERISDEMKKLLIKAPKPSIGLTLARELGIVEKYWPELQALIGTPQEPEWHPEGDVWIHTLMVTDEAAKIVRREDTQELSSEEKFHVVLGAMCHDFGKPAVTAVIEGRIRSRGHQEAGVAPAHAFCRRFAFGEAAENAAATVALTHLRPVMLYNAKQKGELSETQYRNALRRLIRETLPALSWQALLAAAEADFRGRGIAGVDRGPYMHGQLMRETVMEHGLDKEAAEPLLQGRDLLALGLPAGPKLGELIREAEEMRDNGELTTREEAIEWARTKPN